MVDWTHVSLQFFSTFHFTVEDPAQREALLQIKDFIFHWNPKEATPR
jgi:hypothetical protein